MIDANSILYAQLYSNGWNGDSITLPDDFGYIVAFIASNAVELLNETFPSIPAKILFDQNKYIFMPNDNGTLATQEWVNEQGFGSGGSIDTTADITWEGNHRFNGNVQFWGDCAMDYIHCDTQANFNGDAYFYGVVDFTNATEVKVGDELTIGSRESYFHAYEKNLTIFDNRNLYLWVEDENGDSSDISILGNHINYQSGTHTFYGTVDFTNATVIGLPSGGGGLDIPSEVINYDSENNALTFNANNVDFNAVEKVFINNNSNYWYLESNENGDQFGIELNDQAVMFNISYDKTNDSSSIFFDGNIVDFANTQEVKVGDNLTIGSRGARLNETGDYLGILDPNNIYLCIESGNNSSIDIYGDNIEYYSLQHNFSGNVKFSGEIDFSNATVTGLPSSGGGGSLNLDADYNWNGNHTFNNGITLNGALTLANNGEIDDSEDSLSIYKGSGSMWIGTEEGGEIRITNDEMCLESYTNLMLISNQDLTFSAMGGINIYSGENDDTYFEVSPTEFNVTANNGNINFSTANQGSIRFNARSEESESHISMYDTTIEYGAQYHSFFGTVDFSDATVTGLPSGGGLTKTKVTLAQLRTMLSAYSSNLGKLIQFVYKGSTTQPISSMINSIGLVQITNHGHLYKKSSAVDMTESCLSGTTYVLSVSASTNTAFISYQPWERNFDDGTNIVENATEFNITDTNFDIYIIGD